MIPDLTRPVPACDSEGAVTFVFDQTATGPTTFAGTFQSSGAVSDSGTTEDEPRRPGCGRGRADFTLSQPSGNVPYAGHLVADG
jgi:hypothetical protein